jgi:hypothetical protein
MPEQEQLLLNKEYEALHFEISRKEQQLFSEFKSRPIENQPDALGKLDSPEFLNSFFSQRGLEIISPLSIMRRNGSTLFTTAGVQILDPILYENAPIHTQSQAVIQPVFRTQYIDDVQEGISTSFVNPSTELINPSPSNHISLTRHWLDLLSQLGLDPKSFSFTPAEEVRSWGGQNFHAHVVRIDYKGVEVGDTSFLFNFPQTGRPPLQVSDIGFGVERLRWLFEPSYAKSLGFSQEEALLGIASLDHIRTLVLLAGSGLKPSNKEHGYRFRQLSKRVIDQNTVTQEESLSLMETSYKLWSKWIKLSQPLDEVKQAIDTENQRNFNRTILNLLEPVRGKIDIDINLPIGEFLKRLKGSRAKKEDVALLKGLRFRTI